MQSSRGGPKADRRAVATTWTANLLTWLALAAHSALTPEAPGGGQFAPSQHPARKGEPVSPRNIRLRTLAIAGGLALLALAPPVWAANFGSNTEAYLTAAHACDGTTGSQCIANNGLHSYFLSVVETNQATATRSTCTFDYEPVLDVSCSERTISTGADLLVLDSTYFTSFWAWTYCPSASAKLGADPNMSCTPQALKYDISHTAAYDTLAERNYLACHEFGHSLGLRHSGDSASCLFPNSATSGVLTSHEIFELNSHYEIPQ